MDQASIANQRRTPDLNARWPILYLNRQLPGPVWHAVSLLFSPLSRPATNTRQILFSTIFCRWSQMWSSPKGITDWSVDLCRYLSYRQAQCHCIFETQPISPCRPHQGNSNIDLGPCHSQTLAETTGRPVPLVRFCARFLMKIRKRHTGASASVKSWCWKESMSVKN